MRRGLLTLLALVGASSPAWAQAQFFPFAGAQETSVKVSADQVVARIMTFDQNNDGRVAIGELSERMRPLVARGDTNGDEALDPMEIHQLAHAPVAPQTRFFGSPGSYSFGDDVGLSSRRHIEGALEDLRLAADKSDRAMPIVRSYIEHVENTARASLLSRMETLLSLEQFVTFSRLLDGQQHQMTFRSNGPSGERERVFRVMAMAGIGDLTGQLERMALPAPQNEQARAAVEEYKTRVRLGSEAERSELIDRLKNVLDDEELENYNAALQRRPVVANSFALASLNGVVQGIREQSGGAVPAVLIERIPVDVISR
jgi:hypothetical protein